MSLDKGSRFLTALGLVAAVAPACSSSGGGSPVDAGPDVFVIPRPKFDDAAAGDDAGPVVGVGDGTTGRPCKTTADCRPDGGPGVNVCSNDTAMNGLIGPIFPTPVCFLPTCNDPGDGLVHYCDGPSDTSTAPGVCLPTGTGTSGFCFPQCTIPVDGSPPTGCPGKNACTLAGFGVDPTTNAVSAVGVCQGGCAADADCPGGSHCQQNDGLCVTALHNPTKQLGKACTTADARSRACNCLLTPNSPAAGYCTQFCTVGGIACPAGYACDTGQPSTITDQSGAPQPGFTVENTGLAGTCVAVCQLGADAGPASDGATPPATDAGDAATAPPVDAGVPLAACPPNSTCGTTTPLGPNCMP